MTYVQLFPLAEYWWFYVAFTAFVLGALALDLGVFHRAAHAVSFREALTWICVWVTLALTFCFLLHQYSLWKFSVDARLLAVPGFDPVAAANQVGLEFLTGYIVEQALSVDNVFVFLVVFTFFGIPAKYQYRVLFFGILGAIVFRITFIAISSSLMKYHWVVILFGVFLLITGLKIIFAPEKPMDPEKNPVIKLLRRHLPITPDFHDQKFFVNLGGILYATPLFITLVFIEFTDIVFAVDSVPAIFAITREPLIVFTSNVFAILGLRAMFFVLSGVMDKFHFLKYGLGLVLMFVGLKMVWLDMAFGGKFPITWSLGIIATLISGSILISFCFPAKEQPE